MASFNRVILIGNITRGIELKYTPGGTAVTELGLAVNDRRKGKDGEYVEETTFVEVTVWGRTAEIANEYLSKGRSVMIEGRLKLDTWEKDGEKKSKIRVVCENLVLLSDGKRDGERGGQHSASNSSSAKRSSPQTRSQPGAEEVDEIPF